MKEFITKHKPAFIACCSALAVAITAAAVTLGIKLAHSADDMSDPDFEMAAYVKAFTGGRINASTSIKVEFTSNVGAATSAQGLISFSPALEGEAAWVNASTLEFTPAQDQMTPGQSYSASVDLEPLYNIKRKFKFNFTVNEKLMAMQLDAPQISAANARRASVKGKISFSSDIPDSLEDVLSFTYSGQGGKIHIEGDSFVIEDLQVGENDCTLTISADAAKYGYKAVATGTSVIPGHASFRIIDAQFVPGTEPYVVLTFSQPLDKLQNLNGLLHIAESNRQRVTKDGNKARVYFESHEGEINLDVSANVRSAGGQTLGQSTTLTFDAVELNPSVELKIQGNILPDPSSLILPFEAANLSAVDLTIVKIYENNILSYLQDNTMGEDDHLRKYGRLIYKATLDLRDTQEHLNLKKKNLFAVDLSNVIKEDPGAFYRIHLHFCKEYSLYGHSENATGAQSSQMTMVRTNGISPEDQEVWDTPNGYYSENYFDWWEYEWKDRDNPATASYYMQSGRFPTITLMQSSIGIIAKQNESGKMWVAVSDILKAQPIGSAEVTVYNYQLQPIGSATTGQDGLAQITLSGKAFLVVARSGGRSSYLRVAQGEDKSLSRFDTGGEKISKGLKAFVYGERGVWRPGDNIFLTIVLEDKDNKLPANHPVSVELYTPQGQLYDKKLNSNGCKGFYSFNLKTAESDPTGIWDAYFKVGGATFHKSLHIETIKPNRLKITNNLGDEIITKGQNKELSIQAKWLTGSDASGLKFQLEMIPSLKSKPFKGYENYSFYVADAQEYRYSKIEMEEKKLDALGRFDGALAVPDIEGAPGMLNIKLLTRVFEPGGDASIVPTSLTYSPFSSYVGLQVPSVEENKWLETDTDHQFEVISLNAGGRKLNGQRIEYRIYKMNWNWWWESSRTTLDSFVSQHSLSPMASGVLTTSGGKASFDFRVNYPDWGRYLVYVRDLDSGHEATRYVTIDWPGWRGRSDREDPSGLSMLTFSSDKKTYAPGEKATLFIPASAGSRALISLENATGVVRQQWVEATGTDLQYKFDITADMAPNIYAHVTLLQTYAQSANSRPVRMYGVCPISVEDPMSHITPLITVPDAVHPQETFKITVKEKDNRPMAYTIAIVDEGLLDITSFKTPDPWSTMYKREALGIRTWDMYDQVVGAFAGRYPNLLSIGGDQDFSRDKVSQNRFNPVVKFMGPYSLEKGSATHDVTLPMYVGSVKVMVVAGDGNAYGNAQKAVAVRSPLMVLPTLPRIMGCGEQITIPVNVFAMEDDVRDAKVSISIDGPLKLQGSASTEISFSGKGDKLVYFKALGSKTEGTAHITVTAEGNGHKATDTINLEVRNPNPCITSVTRKLLPAGSKETFTWDEGSISAKVEVASFPSLDVKAMLEYVMNYPYACSEQLSSRGMTMLYLMPLLSTADAQKASTEIPQIIKELGTRQIADGSFVYWSGDRLGNSWVTSMAGQFLCEAHRAGYSVDSRIISKWQSHQKKAAGNFKREDGNDIDQAYRLYTLALAGAAEEGAMNRLRETRSLADDAKWRLAAAYAVLGKKNVANEITDGLSIAGYGKSRRYFGSPARDLAMILETMVLTGDTDGAMNIASQVAKEGSAEYYTTQNTAFGALAMSRLSEIIPEKTIDVKIGSKTIQSTNVMVVEDLKPGEGKVEIANNAGAGNVYISVSSTSRKAAGTVTSAASNGLGLKREFKLADGSAADISSLKQGTEFYEHITVTNLGHADLENLALTQICPSGWEIFNDRLYGTELGESRYSHKDIRDDRTDWFFDLERGESKIFKIRYQASYEGSFALPGAVCEAMYDNKISANTASAKTSVVR